MIVRHSNGRLQLITQPDHARLAAAIMEHCAALAGHPRRATILEAIAEHDTGWAVEDASPRINPTTGAVLDFITAPTSVRQGVWPRCVALLGTDNAYAAALVAQHAATVYYRQRGNPEWKDFFRDMEQRRDALLRQCEAPLEQLLEDYTFVRLADIISLNFCTDATDLAQYGDWQVSRTPDGVAISPDIFGGATVAFEISARELIDEPRESDEALWDAIRSSPTVILRGSAHGRADAAS
jgi:hypothetical protein